MRQHDFTNPRTAPFVEPRCRGELPHLYKDGCSYFLTFRLWDAIDGSIRQSSNTSSCGAGVSPARLPYSVDQIVLFNDPPLQLGSCLLAQPAIADVVQSA